MANLPKRPDNLIINPPGHCWHPVSELVGSHSAWPGAEGCCKCGVNRLSGHGPYADTSKLDEDQFSYVGTIGAGEKLPTCPPCITGSESDNA